MSTIKTHALPALTPRPASLLAKAAFLAAATLTAACSDQPTPVAPGALPTSADFAKGGGGGPPLPPKLAFVTRSPTGYGRIDAMVSEAEGITTLIPGDYNADPAWSSDYRKIAFVRYENGGPSIYVANASGTGLKRLASGVTPRWSPDGSQIAFAAPGTDGNFDIFVMSPTGKNIRQLTTTSASDFYPSWSPDGARLAFVSRRTGAHEIFIMDADGSNPVQRTNCAADGAQCSAPTWSPLPDDTRIAYFYLGTILGDEFHSIRWTDADLGGLAIVHTGDGLGRPAWSPDATRIAFAKEVDPTNAEIFSVSIFGTDLMRITYTPGYEQDVAWAR